MAGTIRRTQDAIERTEDEGKSGEKYVLVSGGDTLRGLEMPVAWLPLKDVSAPMVLHGYVRYGQTNWEDITLLANWRQARNFIERKAQEWGREALAEFDAEGLVDKTTRATAPKTVRA